MKWLITAFIKFFKLIIRFLEYIGGETDTTDNICATNASTTTDCIDTTENTAKIDRPTTISMSDEIFFDLNIHCKDIKSVMKLVDMLEIKMVFNRLLSKIKDDLIRLSTQDQLTFKKIKNLVENLFKVVEDVYVRILLMNGQNINVDNSNTSKFKNRIKTEIPLVGYEDTPEKSKETKINPNLNMDIPDYSSLNIDDGASTHSDDKVVNKTNTAEVLKSMKHLPRRYNLYQIDFASPYPHYS